MAKGSSSEEESQAGGARAILRVPAVLTELAATPAGLSLAELTARLDLPKASLYRIVQTLRRGGYLAQEGSIFRLGPASLALARMIGETARPAPFPTCLRPVLDWLAQKTGETVMLAEWTEGQTEVVYADVIESGEAIRFAVNLGDRRPLYCAASGKAVLAFLTSEARRRYFDQAEFTPFTAQTADRQGLAGDMEKIRATGVAWDHGGRVEGASGVASPILAENGAVCAAMSVAGPSDRIEHARDRMAALVFRAGERASRVLGYRGEFPTG